MDIRVSRCSSLWANWVPGFVFMDGNGSSGLVDHQTQAWVVITCSAKLTKRKIIMTFL